MTSKAVREFPHRALITSFPERGLIGSRHHLGALSEDVRRHIALYINLDMVGSPNFARACSSGPALVQNQTEKSVAGTV